MKVVFNTMFKNETVLLDAVLPIWIKYPIDLFIFYDDNSTDDSLSVIEKYLPKDRFIIINDKLPFFNESYHRQKMIDVSIENNADIILSIDVDELLTSTIVAEFDVFLNFYKKYDMRLFWYNVCNDSLKYYRNDPAYQNNYRTFVLPTRNIGRLDANDWKYHTPRTPTVTLPNIITKKYGVIHLQAINKKYYAIKQLWYKHYEFIKYGHTVEFINSRYDYVVNQLNFKDTEIDQKLIDGIVFDESIFNNLAVEKGYLKFIHEHYNEKLITFGKEFL